jgi:hypothetical protein
MDPVGFVAGQWPEDGRRAARPAARGVADIQRDGMKMPGPKLSEPEITVLPFVVKGLLTEIFDSRQARSNGLGRLLFFSTTTKLSRWGMG